MLSALLPAILLLNPINMMIEFIVFCVCIAVIIILARWLIGLTGLSIPAPLMYVLGLLLFLLLLLVFLNWTGLWDFGGHGAGISIR